MSYFFKSTFQSLIILIIFAGLPLNLIGQNTVAYSTKRGGKQLTELSEKQKEKVKQLFVNVKGEEYTFPDETILACKNLETIFINGIWPSDENNWFKNYNNYTKVKFDKTKIKELQTVKNFGFTFVSIDQVFENISEMNSLENIEIIFTDMDSISDEIEKLNNLEKLTINTNQISFISNKIGILKNLKVCDISNNGLKSLPKFSKQNTNLEIIILNNGNTNLIESKYIPNNEIDYTKSSEQKRLQEYLEDIPTLKKVFISTSNGMSGSDLLKILNESTENQNITKKVRVSEPLNL